MHPSYPFFCDGLSETRFPKTLVLAYPVGHLMLRICCTALNDGSFYTVSLNFSKKSAILLTIPDFAPTLLSFFIAAMMSASYSSSTFGLVSTKLLPSMQSSSKNFTRHSFKGLNLLFPFDAVAQHKCRHGSGKFGMIHFRNQRPARSNNLPLLYLRGIGVL